MQKIRIFSCFVRSSLPNGCSGNIRGFLGSPKEPLKWRINQQRGFTGQNIERKGRKITPWQWFLLSVPATTFALGCWQVKRKAWKENLIKDLERKTTQNPLELPENLEDLEDLEYRPVIIRGHFLHDREIYMGPRSLIQHGDGTSRSGVFSKQGTTTGYLVVTPLKLDGRDEIILVNRGWVPKNRQNPTSRPEGQISGHVELVGIVRLGEARPQFSPESKGDHFLYRNLPKMCALTGAGPYFVDATDTSSVPGGPHRGSDKGNRAQ
uniref:SURF1-like protein n=1 Tax=Lutzomyia longipalpis TaxID=7200 RepID=A0A1B0CJQ7_LUTLO